MGLCLSSDSDPESHNPILPIEGVNRYFRVPITKDGGKGSGIWYTHFLGEFIQREIEIVGGVDGSVKCLKTGVDNTQMCQLKLSETGLTRRRGTEIFAQEFEREWKKLAK